MTSVSIVRDGDDVPDAASQRIADEMRLALLADQFAPGQRIRQEDIANRFGASRMPVREAFRILESEGLVEIVPRRGARVPQIDAHELDVIYQMRERLEPLTLAESIPRLTADALEQLEALQERIEKNTDVNVFLDLDRQLHLLTYSGCEVEQLSSVVTRMWNSTHHYRRVFMNQGGERRWWAVNAEHRLLLDAIARRDVEDGEHILAGHIRRTRVELANLSPDVVGLKKP